MTEKIILLAVACLMVLAVIIVIILLVDLLGDVMGLTKYAKDMKRLENEINKNIMELQLIAEGRSAELDNDSR